MSSIREQIIVAAVTALNTGRPGGVPATERTRLRTYAEADLPAMVLFPVREAAENAGGPRPLVVRGTLQLSIECRALGSASVRPDQAVDPLLNWVVVALGGKRLSDGAGGFLNFEIERGDIEWTYDQGDNPMCLAVIQMFVTYQHLVANAESRT